MWARRLALAGAVLFTIGLSTVNRAPVMALAVYFLVVGGLALLFATALWLNGLERLIPEEPPAPGPEEEINVSESLRPVEAARVTEVPRPPPPASNVVGGGGETRLPRP